MDAVFGLFVVVAALVAFDLSSLRWGTDSRDPIGDDHRR